MPFLYKKNKKNMKQINEMSKEEALDFIKFKPMYQFTENDAKRIVSLVRDYIDPNQPNCATCGSGLRPAKDKLINFYNANESDIIAISDGSYCFKCCKPICVCETIIEEPIIEKPKRKRK